MTYIHCMYVSTSPPAALSHPVSWNFHNATWNRSTINSIRTNTCFFSKTAQSACFERNIQSSNGMSLSKKSVSCSILYSIGVDIPSSMAIYVLMEHAKPWDHHWEQSGIVDEQTCFLQPTTSATRQACRHDPGKTTSCQVGSSMGSPCSRGITNCVLTPGEFALLRGQPCVHSALVLLHVLYANSDKRVETPTEWLPFYGTLIGPLIPTLIFEIPCFRD